MPNETTEDWERIFDNAVYNQWNGGNPYFPNWDMIKDFIRTLLKAERAKAQKEIIYSLLTDWLREYANRPLADRKDPFTEVAELQTELRKKFNL